MTETTQLDSPCIKVCVLNPATRICTGCYRTLDEIAHWSAYSRQERDLVYRRLAARRVALAGSDARKD